MKRIDLITMGFLLLGCGGETKFHPVQGTVTMEGEALPGALVSFCKVDGRGQVIQAITDDRGEFELQMLGTNGIPPGEYKVLVAKDKKMPRPVESLPEPLRQYVGKKDLDPKVQARLEKAVLVTPVEYNDPRLTPFNVTVPAQGAVRLELKMSGKN